jgi:glycosyltransferase involved in cell wall biosynthesis
MNTEFSFIILTFNEEVHLPKLLESISGLNAAIHILDSGSTDNTLNIAEKYKAEVKTNAFENHPKQWDYAIKNFNIQTPWTIGLDADQVVTPELFLMLQNFKSENYSHLNGIYFNRKNYFKGTWIKYGGFYPKFLLKMFRTSVGYSDLNENMDHRFVVNGATQLWKNGHIIEENLKENKISFWIAKHNRYSDLTAEEEVERLNKLRNQTNQAKFWGNPDERNAWLKKLWWKLPLGLRPFIYFSYRIFIRLGILDGANGILFHFLQGFWFRLIVDVKIKEILKSNAVNLQNK